MYVTNVTLYINSSKDGRMFQHTGRDIKLSLKEEWQEFNKEKDDEGGDIQKGWDVLSSSRWE